MYLINSVVDLALDQHQEQWKSKTHRLVAISLCIANSCVTTMDKLKEIVRVVNSISDDKIKTITRDNFVEKYKIYV